MILTGQCKEDYIKYVAEKYKLFTSEDMFIMTSIVIVENALIIDFLDNIKYEDKPIFSHCFNLYWTNRVSYQTHNDICLEAIKMCNKFYNEINKQIIKT